MSAVEQVTGFVPRVLTDALAGDGVALLRAEDRVFEAMLDGWRAQMLARGLTTGWIKSSVAMVTRFQAVAARPAGLHRLQGLLRLRVAAG